MQNNKEADILIFIGSIKNIECNLFLNKSSPLIDDNKENRYDRPRYYGQDISKILKLT